MIISNEELQRLVTLFDKVDRESDRWDFPLTDFANRVIISENELYPKGKIKDNIITVKCWGKDIEPMLFVECKFLCYESDIKYILSKIQSIVGIKRNDFNFGMINHDRLDFLYKGILIVIFPNDFLIKDKYFIEINTVLDYR